MFVNNFINKQKQLLLTLAEELNIDLDLDLRKYQANIPQNIIDSINAYIKKVQPVIQIGINKFKLTALLSTITPDMMSYADYLKLQTKGLISDNTSNGSKTFTIAGLADNLPAKFILSSILLPIRNQGDTNCCVAFSTACAIEYKNILKKTYMQYLSPVFIYNNRVNNEGNYGMTSVDAINIAINHGICTEKSYPFPGSLQISIQPYIYEEASKYKITQFAYITDINMLKFALFNNGPCMAILKVYNNSNTFWIQYEGETYKGNHCITITGYNDDKKQILIRNSWGTLWGYNGYSWIDYSDFNLLIECWTILPETGQPPENVYNIEGPSSSNQSNKIIGLDPIVFYSILGGVIFFIILIIIIIIIINKNTNKDSFGFKKYKK
jgi:hypothetical protein